jgi:hypothetical protein
MDAGDARIAALIREVRESSNEAMRRQCASVRALAEIGAPAVAPVLRGMREPCPPGCHPRDMVEALGRVLREIASRDPQPLIEVLERDGAPPDPEL